MMIKSARVIEIITILSLCCALTTTNQFCGQVVEIVSTSFSVLCPRRLTVCFSVHNNCRLASAVSLARCNNIIKNTASNNGTVRGESSWLGGESTSCRQSTCKAKESHVGNTMNREILWTTRIVFSVASLSAYASTVNDV